MKSNGTQILLLTLIFTIAFTFQVESQSFNFEPGEIVTEYIELESYRNVQVDIMHPDADDITFGWVTIENNMLDKWEYSSCDNGGCYSLLPDSAVLGPLADTVPGFIRLTVNPRDQAGTSTVQIYVYDIKYPDQGKFVNFEIIASEVTSINEKKSPELKIYPNPASNFVTLENPSSKTMEFELMDLTGKTVFRDFVYPEQNRTISLLSYPKGMYFVRMNDDHVHKLIIK